jgi:hypothetical protein
MVSKSNLCKHNPVSKSKKKMWSKASANAAQPAPKNQKTLPNPKPRSLLSPLKQMPKKDSAVVATEDQLAQHASPGSWTDSAPTPKQPHERNSSAGFVRPQGVRDRSSSDRGAIPTAPRDNTEQNLPKPSSRQLARDPRQDPTTTIFSPKTLLVKLGSLLTSCLGRKPKRPRASSHRSVSCETPLLAPQLPSPPKPDIPRFDRPIYAKVDIMRRPEYSQFPGLHIPIWSATEGAYTGGVVRSFDVRPQS